MLKGAMLKGVMLKGVMCGYSADINTKPLQKIRKGSIVLGFSARAKVS